MCSSPALRAHVQFAVIEPGHRQLYEVRMWTFFSRSFQVASQNNKIAEATTEKLGYWLIAYQL